ncbi:MAG TPA: DUF6159 family protein [Kofleriaceae bacterium]|jgi:hypothetical protein
MTVFEAIVALTKASWRMLQRHRRLVWFPILEMVATLVALLVIVPLLGVTDNEIPWTHLLAIGATLEVIRVFFAVALTSQALEALRGREPSIGAGLGAAVARLPTVFMLALVTAPVGFVLGVLGRSSRFAMRFARRVFGTAWALVTYLAIPVMVQERRGCIPSLKRSGELFRNTWGETALSEVGVRVVGAQLAIAIIVIAVVLIRVLGESLFTALVLLAVAACLIGIVVALEAIYRAALYVFAAEGVVPEPFGGPELEDIWQVK